MNHPAASKCNGYGLESLLAGYLDKGSLHCRDPVCEFLGSVHWEGVKIGSANFFDLSLKLTD